LAVLRWRMVAALMSVGVLVVSTAAGARGRLHATLTTPVPAHENGGDHVAIAWRLRDAAGRSVAVSRVYVKIVCPEGTDSTTTTGRRLVDGSYRAVALVPPGGIGTITIRTHTTVFPITNLRRA